MQSTKRTTNTDSPLTIVRARRAQEAEASRMETERQAPIIEQRRRENEARKVVLLAELDETLQDFVRRMQATDYPGAREYTLVEEFVPDKGIFRRTRNRYVQVVGWTIGLGIILLSDGRVCDGLWESGDRIHESSDPFKNYLNDMLEDLIDALAKYPEKVR